MSFAPASPSSTSAASAARSPASSGIAAHVATGGLRCCCWRGRAGCLRCGGKHYHDDLYKWMVSPSRGGTQLAVHEPRFTAHESAFRLVFAIPDQLLKRPKISVKMA